MLPNLFSASPLVWAGLVGTLAALPVLIHLINLMRHRKVEWAAMEFLLRSYRKHRNWIWLKQLFLLLSRIAALLLLLFILSQMGCEDSQMSRWLGTTTTHHYILLDDSYSMSDQSGEGTAFDRALLTVSKIVASFKDQENQKITLVRLSRINDLEGEIRDEVVDRNFDQRIQRFKERIDVSPFALSPALGLEKVSSWIQERKSERSVVYLLSDFRERDWAGTDNDLSANLVRVEEAGGRVEFIRCVKENRGNLTLVSLTPIGSVRTAGVPLMYQLAVKNNGQTTAEKVQVKLETVQFRPPEQDDTPASLESESDSLPTVFIDRIPPGQTVKQDFTVYFSEKGYQFVRAELPDDPIRYDNSRYATNEFFSTSNVLLIDSEATPSSRFVTLGLNPGNMTGLTSTIRDKAFLRDMSPGGLNEFDAVFLLDPGELDNGVVARLEEFVRAGGGVVLFLGPNTNPQVVNSRMFRGGEGMLPFPIGKQVNVPERVDQTPDVVPLEHPIFPPGLNNAFLQLVSINRFFEPESAAVQAQADKSVRVAATLRGNRDWPLILEKDFGDGKFMLVTTSAGPVWNNWARNPTFPPLLLLTHNRLAQGRFPAADVMVGQSVPLNFDIEQYGPNVELLIPVEKPDSRGSRTRLRESMELESNQYRLTLGLLNRETDHPGLIDVWLKSSSGRTEVQRLAVNVEPDEGELKLISRQNLASALDSAQVNIMEWDQFNPDPGAEASSDLGKVLLLILIGVLVLEQWLAYQCSFHPSSRHADSTRRRPADSFGAAGGNAG